MPFPSFEHIPEVEPYREVPDYHAVLSIKLCELIDAGFLDWSEASWNWLGFAYDEETYNRLTTAFIEKFYWREIGIIPPGEWKQQLLYKIKYELCPKYNRLYKIADQIEPLANSSEYEKSRSINSEYPETLLSANADYVSSGNDMEREKIINGSTIDKLEQFKRFKDIDQLFLEELEVFFSNMFTVNINGW